MSRGPTTATLRAIEAVLRKAAVPMSRYEIRKRLGDRVGAPLLDGALDYMAEHDMVFDEGPGGKVVWVRPGAQSGVRRRARAPGNPSPSLQGIVRRRRKEILDVASRYGARQVRVFGSVARGDARPGSDLDLLVRFDPARSLLDQIGLQQDLEDLLGVRVDVVSEGGISPYIRDRVLREAVPL